MSVDGRGGKDPDACRTIGEVAEELRLPQHVLRFWETRFPQVQPLKRAGGRRFYRPDDVALLRAIRDLLYGEGYTIKGVQRLLEDHGPRAFATEPPVASVPHPEGPRAFAGRDSDPDPTRSPPRADARFGAADHGSLVARLDAVASDLIECQRILATVRSAER